MTYKPFHLGSRKHVFVNWDLIEPGYGLSFGGERPESWEMPYGVRLTSHLPRLNRVPLVKADKPWESGNARSGLGVYSTLLEDEGRFRLYYDSGDVSGELNVDQDVGTQRVLAYAESNDGKHWVKPELGLVTYRGSRDNNLVFVWTPPRSGMPTGQRSSKILPRPPRSGTRWFIWVRMAADFAFSALYPPMACAGGSLRNR